MRVYETIFLALALLSLGATLLNVLLTPRLRPSPRTSGPRVSVIIPARNEERAISRTIAAMLGQSWRDLEVIVVDDGSTDATAAILTSFADPRLKVVHGVATPEGWLGKPWALEQGSEAATGELLLFVDADVQYAPAAVAAMADALAVRGTAMLSVFPRVEMHGVWEYAGMTALATAFMGLIHPWLANRTTIAALALGGGVGNIVRRDVYESIGGHRALRDAVIDDIGLAWQIRRAGHRTTAVMGDEFVSVRMYHGLREVVGGFTKNAYAALAGHPVPLLGVAVYLLAFGIAPFVLAFTGAPLILAGVGAIVAARIVLFTWLSYPLWAAIVLHPVTSALWAFILLRSAWHTRSRGGIHWRGRKASTWSRFGR